ncbi:MAG: acyltransferase domain-containing protein, partial [Myxococcales bacterium]|nr:acyltransferase domain-containing protein [Myxococcales bacterium]
VLFALQVALAALWRSWGVIPDAVLGHSMGEVAAAHIAGALSLADAARIICTRSKLMRSLSGRGAMALVELSLEDAQTAIAPYPDTLSIAANNGPRATVLSGDAHALSLVLTTLTAQSIFTRLIKVDVASHSPEVDPLLPDLIAALAPISPTLAPQPMISTVTGEPILGPELGPTYWADNLRNPVRFAHALTRAAADGPVTVLELSPHPILLPSADETLRAQNRDVLTLPSTRRDHPERRALLDTAANLHLRGHHLAWSALNPPGALITLPTYPWQRERHWLSPTPPRARRDLHPLLGRAFTTSTQPDTRFWELSLDLDAHPYLRDHHVAGELILPGAVSIELALTAAHAITGAATLTLEALSFHRPIVLHEHTPLAGELALTREAGRWSFRLSTRDTLDPPTWTLHTTGQLHAEPADAPPPRPLAELRARCPEPRPIAALLAAQQALGLALGPSFQALEALTRGPAEALGQLRLPPPHPTPGHPGHPPPHHPAQHCQPAPQ